MSNVVAGMVSDSIIISKQSTILNSKEGIVYFS